MDYLIVGAFIGLCAWAFWHLIKIERSKQSAFIATEKEKLRFFKLAADELEGICHVEDS